MYEMESKAPLAVAIRFMYDLILVYIVCMEEDGSQHPGDSPAIREVLWVLQSPPCWVSRGWETKSTASHSLLFSRSAVGSLRYPVLGYLRLRN